MSNLPPQNPQNKEVSRVVQTRVEYQGPIPPSTELERYEKILPGSAERILKMAENQSHHRQDLEKKVIQSDVRSSFLGICFAFIITIAALLLAGYCVHAGYPYIGLLFGAGSIGSIVGSFIYGHKVRSEERQKRKD